MKAQKVHAGERQHGGRGELATARAVHETNGAPLPRYIPAPGRGDVILDSTQRDPYADKEHIAHYGSDRKLVCESADERDALLVVLNSHGDLLAANRLRRMLDRFVETDTIDRVLQVDIERECRALGWRGEEQCQFCDFIRDLADAAIAKATGGVA